MIVSSSLQKKIVDLHIVMPLVLFICVQMSCSSSKSPTGSDDSNNTTIDTTKQKIGSEGGTITLKDGLSVVFSQGSVGTSTEFTISKLDPADYFDSNDMQRVLLSCSGSVSQFQNPVEIRVPLPTGMTVADSVKIIGGLVDEKSGAVTVEPVSVRLIEGKTVAVISTNHFSNRILEWFTGPTPPDNAGPLTVPYYNQGSTEYCWATCLQMVSEAAKHDNSNEVFSIIGEMGVDEGGITSFSFRTSSKLANIIDFRTGLKPERYTWDYVNIGKMKDHLKRELGVRNHPVALFNGIWEHAVVVVGYDGNTFYIHDPQSTSVNQIGYTKKTWDEIINNMGITHNMVTLSIPTQSLDTSRPEITVNIMNDAFDFVKPQNSLDPASKYYRFKWDYANLSGYSFKEANTTAVKVLPGSVTTLVKCEGSGIEIANSSRTDTKTVSVWLDITSTGSGKTQHSLQKSITLSPNSSRVVDFGTVLVDKFRDLTPSTVEYILSASALVNGKLNDTASILFKIDKLEIAIDSISPETGSAGSPVTINGFGFGAERGNTLVTFNGVTATEFVSWSDTKVIVKVPATASTGDIKVKRGTIVSSTANSYFTVTTEPNIAEKLKKTNWAFGQLSVIGKTLSYGDGDVVGIGSSLNVTWSGLSFSGREEDKETFGSNMPKVSEISGKISSDGKMLESLSVSVTVKDVELNYVAQLMVLKVINVPFKSIYSTPEIIVYELRGSVVQSHVTEYVYYVKDEKGKFFEQLLSVDWNNSLIAPTIYCEFTIK